MIKKIIMIILVITIGSASIYHYMVSQPKNIFDEIYLETKSTYRSNNILGNIEGFDIRSVWPSEDSNIADTPFGVYKESDNPEEYSNIGVDFNFGSGVKGIIFRFEWQVNSEIAVWYISHYNVQEKEFIKSLAIIEEPRKAGQYISEEAKVKEIIELLGLSVEELDKHYVQIINQKFLTDWLSIYDSNYSPEDYGDVTVETQWEDW